ncbi:MAG: GatB/YqeY domain-containing protein, partial [Bdellovibrionales bacterium]|nr:GatB/YqeY domain-containing protein [Bdellovibrionales bacterium]
IRFLHFLLKYKEVELRPNPISNDDVLAVVKKLVKQRKESIEQFQQASRQDLVEKEERELKVLEAYLPQQMSKEQLEVIVTEVVANLQAKTIKDMGAVMKESLARAAGAADNKTLSEIIKAKLS